MYPSQFPSLPLAGWRPTRDIIHSYAQVLGAVRAQLTPRQKHSAHRSLRVSAVGLTTMPILAGPFTFEMVLDCAGHQAVIATSRGDRWQWRLRGQSPSAFYDEVFRVLAWLGVRPEIDRAPFSSSAPGAYDMAAVERFWQALSQIDALLNRFKGELRAETSPVQLWPHGFDLAMLWFSGRLVPGVDPNIPRDADEQMNFGFSTGDATIPEPYFYATAYPLPNELPKTPWADGVIWHTRGWQGAVLRYEPLVGVANAADRLLDYWRAAQHAGARLMLGAGG